MKVIQSLWFEKDMEAALRLYTSLVPGSTLQPITTLAAETPSGPPGSVKLASFTLGDQSYRAIEAGPLDSFNHSFGITLECDSQAEIDRVWQALLDSGGTPEQCGWLRDRWGMCWQVVPRRLGELMSTGDAARTRRVTAAMLTMVKFDITALEAAAAAG
ncbi:MAG: VOC family protein [Proteobacteria bacterium]|nr:VOC family protein [Pseudomonadota bacterium]